MAVSVKIKTQPICEPVSVDLLKKQLYLPLALGKSHGCMLDLYVDGSSSYPLTFPLSPSLPGYNNDGTQTTNIYYTIENFSSGSHTVQAQITFNSTQS
jgi:hypothetical protein